MAEVRRLTQVNPAITPDGCLAPVPFVPSSAPVRVCTYGAGTGTKGQGDERSRRAGVIVQSSEPRASARIDATFELGTFTHGHSCTCTLPAARLHVQGFARACALTRAQRIRSRSVIVYVYVYRPLPPHRCRRATRGVDMTIITVRDRLIVPSHRPIVPLTCRRA